MIITVLRVVQEAVLGVLKITIRLNGTMMREQVEAVKHKHRDPRYCSLYSLAPVHSLD